MCSSSSCAMANNNGDMDTTLGHDLQPWFFPSQTMAANPSSSNSPWNIFSVPNSESAFSFMINEPQARNEAAAYNSLLNPGLEESSQQSRESESGEEDEQRPGKRHQAKNLVAERRRREKIRDGLHALRAIVPKITKMDKASILGDAIEYVKELQQQVKDLQDQLEEDNGKSQPELTPSEPINQGMDSCDPLVRDDEENQHMEPQMEVKQLVANELFLMVLCEHKRGGFARLMEAMSGIGLEVTNASVTTFRSLVLHVFRVEGRDNITVHAEEVRNSLLEMTRSCNKALLTSDAKDIEDSSIGEYHHHHHQELQQQYHHHHRGNRRRCHNPAPSPPTWP